MVAGLLYIHNEFMCGRQLRITASGSDPAGRLWPRYAETKEASGSWGTSKYGLLLACDKHLLVVSPLWFHCC